jgi:hypothetical protein
MEFYLRRLGPKDHAPPRMKQTFPMAVGTVFDCYVKCSLAAQLGLECPTAAAMLERSLTIEPVSEWERAVKMGYQIFMAYEKCGAYERLVAENVTGVEVHTEIGNPPGCDVPIFGELDAVIQPDKDRPPVVFDWKVTGSGSPGNRSPNPGYDQLLSTVHPPRGPHKRAGGCFSELNPSWATQLCMYGWLLRGASEIRSMRVALDQIVVGSEGNIRVARFRSRISPEFQRSVRQRLVEAWGAIEIEDVVPQSIANLGIEAVEAMS